MTAAARRFSSLPRSSPPCSRLPHSPGSLHPPVWPRPPFWLAVGVRWPLPNRLAPPAAPAQPPPSGTLRESEEPGRPRTSRGPAQPDRAAQACPGDKSRGLPLGQGGLAAGEGKKKVKAAEASWERPGRRHTDGSGEVVESVPTGAGATACLYRTVRGTGAGCFLLLSRTAMGNKPGTVRQRWDGRAGRCAMITSLPLQLLFRPFSRFFLSPTHPRSQTVRPAQPVVHSPSLCCSPDLDPTWHPTGAAHTPPPPLSPGVLCALAFSSSSSRSRPSFPSQITGGGKDPLDRTWDKGEEASLSPKANSRPHSRSEPGRRRRRRRRRPPSREDLKEESARVSARKT